MRILLLCGKMDSGGAETHVAALAVELLRRGHAVYLASAGGREADRLIHIGVKHIHLPLDRKSPHSLLLCRQILFDIVRKYKFDVIHAHTRIAAFVGESVSRACSAPLVVTAHARFSMGGFRGALSRWGNKTVTVSNDLKAHIIENCSVNEKNITVIPNGIDTQKFLPMCNKNSEKIRIGFLSRLDSDCSAAAYSLCKTAPVLLRKYSNIEIVIGGGGGELVRIKAFARKVNLTVGRTLIKVVGNVGNVPPFLANCDIFVGVSRAALEAMSCAIPTVLAGNEGFGGVVTGENAHGFARQNFCCRGYGKISERRLNVSLCRLLEITDGERKALGGALREYVIKNSSVRQMADRTERVYEAASKGARQVLLCGYYGYGNMGDDILLRQSIRRARKEYTNYRICALTANGKADSEMFGVRCVNRKNPMCIIREIRRSSSVVLGGGTLLQNKTSRRSLWYYLFIAFFTISRGKSVLLWGNGLGEIYGRTARRAVARLLGSCEHVGLRDGYSLCFAKKLCSLYGKGCENITFERDMAFGKFQAEPHRGEALLTSLGADKGRRIAVAAFRGTESRECIKKLSHMLREEIRQGAFIIYIVMYPREDMSLCRSAQRILGGAIAYPMTSDDIQALMSASDIVYGMRYHALVLAVNAKTPHVGVGSQKKIRYFDEV